MSAVLTVAGEDVSPVTVSDVTVTAGREDVDSQPEASVLNVALIEGRLSATVGSSCVLADDVGVLFGGTITDLDQVPPEDLADGGTTWRTRLIAAGPLADIGRRIVGDEPWPQETDSARVRRILELAGAPHQVNPGLTGPDMLPRDVDAQPAANLARQVAEDALGVLWEQPADTAKPIRYSPQSGRAWNPTATVWAAVPVATTWATMPAGLAWANVSSGTLPGATVPAVELDAAEVFADVVFSQRLGDVVRSARVVYGPDVDGGPRFEATAGTPGASPEIRKDTRLANGAQLVADTIWRARREPAWRLTQITINRADMAAGRWAALRGALGVGMRLILTLPAGSPVGPSWQGFVEGWGHAILDDAHTLILHTSERAMSEPADRWQDITLSLTWAQTAPAEIWDTADELEAA